MDKNKQLDEFDIQWLKLKKKSDRLGFIGTVGLMILYVLNIALVETVFCIPIFVIAAIYGLIIKKMFNKNTEDIKKLADSLNQLPDDETEI